jgi:hypothetical protein
MIHSAVSFKVTAEYSTMINQKNQIIYLSLLFLIGVVVYKSWQKIAFVSMMPDVQYESNIIYAKKKIGSRAYGYTSIVNKSNKNLKIKMAGSGCTCSGVEIPRVLPAHSNVAVAMWVDQEERKESLIKEELDIYIEGFAVPVKFLFVVNSQDFKSVKSTSLKR